MHRCKLFSAGFCISYSSLGGLLEKLLLAGGKMHEKKDIKYTNPMFGHQWTDQSTPLYQGCQDVYYIHHLTSSWPPSRPSRFGLLFLRSCLVRAAVRGPGDTSHDSCCQAPLSVLHSDWHPHHCWVLLSFPPWEHLPCATPHTHNTTSSAVAQGECCCIQQWIYAPSQGEDYTSHVKKLHWSQLSQISFRSSWGGHLVACNRRDGMSGVEKD